MEERKINLPFFFPFHQTPRPIYPYTISKSLLPLDYTASPLPVLLIGDKVRRDAYARVLRYRRGNRGGRRGTQPWLFGGEADKLRVSFMSKSMLKKTGAGCWGETRKSERGQMHKP